MDMLSRRHFLIGIMPDLPYVYIEKANNGNITKVEGFVLDIVKWLAEKYSFTFKCIEPEDKAFGAFLNGSWNGLVGMLVRDEIDIAATDLSITYARSKAVDFAYPYANDPTGLMVPYPKLASTISGLVRPFHYMVWIGFILCLFATATTMWLMRKIRPDRKALAARKNDGVWEFVWFLFRVVTNAQEQSSFSFALNLSTQILVACWCLAALVLVQSYTSSLVSYLMAPKFIPFLNTIDELANDPKIPFVVMKYTSVHSDLLLATSGTFVKLGNKLRAHPENILDSYKNLEDIVAVQRKVASYQSLVLKMASFADYQKTKQCRIAGAKAYLFDDKCSFALPKSSPLTKVLNSDLIFLHEMGLIEHWTKSYLPKHNRCTAQLETLRPPTSKTKMTLNFLSSAFLLYGVGIGCSITALLLEIIFRKCHNNFQ